MRDHFDELGFIDVETPVLGRLAILLGMFAPGPVEIGICCTVILVLFGPKQLPKIARSLGSVGVEFKRGAKEVQEVKDEARKMTDEIVNELRDR